MLFNSYQFILFFLPVTFVIYFYLNYKRLTTHSKVWLLISSLFFYGWWSILYLPLIISSVLFNFLIARWMLKHNESKKKLLKIGVIFNVGLLAYFKYSDFFISNTNSFFNAEINMLNLALPLAISFFTFQQIAFLVDSYKGIAKEKELLDYAVFVTFFPQLIAGPIVHHKEMMPQFKNIRNKVINYRNIALGLFIFSIGLFKKVVIADTFSKWATAGFDKTGALNLAESWVTSLSYTFQLYFDFSGYTDMAIGLALLFNIRLPINFNSPYKSTNIKDFWSSWHITLSRFLRDYVYIPMGGNKVAKSRLYGNLFCTFLIGGLWHGAGWTFIFWGILHAFAIIIHRIWSGFGLTLNKFIAWFITFNFINISWIFFRAKDWDSATRVLNSMFSLNNVVLPKFLSNLSFLDTYNIIFASFLGGIGGDRKTPIIILFGFILVLFFKNSNELILSSKLNYKTMAITLFTFITSLLMINKNSYFLYFNF